MGKEIKKIGTAVKEVFDEHDFKDLIDCGVGGDYDNLYNMAEIFAEVLEKLGYKVDSYYTEESVDGYGKYNIFLTINGQALKGRRISAWYDDEDVAEEVEDIIEEVK